MSGDVILGRGSRAAPWVAADDAASARYHDEVWGTRTYDESAMFEALTLGVFEVGLSWSIVFGKRDAFRAAFHGFDVAAVAAMTGQDVDRLVQDAKIIRNRGNIQATVDNARAVLAASPSLATLAKPTDHPQAGTEVRRRPAQIDRAVRRVRQATEVPGATVTSGRRACTHS